jgi:hypothetical protein
MSWVNISGTDVTGAALTENDDTNVTMTLGGTPSTALLRSVSMSLGWTGQLAVSRGGTGANSLQGVLIGNLTAPVTAVTGIGGQLLRANPSTGVYEFFTPSYMSNPMTTLGDIIYGNAAGAPTRLAANSTANNMYLRSVSSGIPSWASIAGGDITGAALTEVDDTNVTCTLGGTPANALLRSVSITLGWTGQLSVPRGGTGAATLTGVVIGNSTGAMTAVAGTSEQLLRRNTANTAYEFFTPTFLSNPMTSLGDIIYGNASGAPLRLGANATSANLFLRSVSSGAPSWSAIGGTDVTGAAITTANDTNIQITASGNTTNALLRTLTLTAGWTGALSPGRGGTGATSITGVVIGNGIGTMVGVAGTADQLLRRNSANTAYEFFTPTFLSNPMTSLGDIIYGNAAGAPLRLGANATSTNKYLRSVNGGTPSWEEVTGFLTGSGTTNYVAKWTPSGSALGNSQIFDNGTNVGIGTSTTQTKLTTYDSANLFAASFGGASSTPNIVALGTVSSTPTINGYSYDFGLSTSLQLQSHGGNVGIGTASPSTKLHVASSGGEILRLEGGSGNTGNNFIGFRNGSTDLGFIGYGSAAANSLFLGNYQNAPIIFYTNSTTYATLTGAGNFGIGTPTPTHKLEVVGVVAAGNDSATNGSIMLQDRYSGGHLGNVGTMYSGGNLMMGYGVTPSTSSATAFLSSAFVSGVDFARSSITLGTDVSIYTGAAQSVAIGSSVTMSERFRLENNGRLRLNAYTSSSSFTGIAAGYLAFTSGGYIITTATPGGVSGTQDYLAKFDSTGIAVGNSRIVDNGTNFLLNSASAYVTGLNLIGDIGMQSASGQASAILMRSNQTPTSGTSIGIIDSYAITTGSTYTQSAGIDFRASQNWNSTSAGTDIFVQTAPDNTIAPADMFVFLNNGAVRFIGRTSNPIGAAAGTMYYNSSANNMRYYNGTSWITF